MIEASYSKIGKVGGLLFSGKRSCNLQEDATCGMGGRVCTASQNHRQGLRSITSRLLDKR